MSTLKDVSPPLKAKRRQRKIGVSGIYGICCHMHSWFLALSILDSALSTTVYSQIDEGDHHFGPVMEFDLSQYRSDISKVL